MGVVTAPTHHPSSTPPMMEILTQGVDIGGMVTLTMLQPFSICIFICIINLLLNKKKHPPMTPMSRRYIKYYVPQSDMGLYHLA
jgi:hypothetical protein